MQNNASMRWREGKGFWGQQLVAQVLLKGSVRDLQAQAAERTAKANRWLDKLIDLFGVYLKHKTGADVGSSSEESEARHGKHTK